MSEPKLTQEQVAEVYEKYGHLVLRRCRSILRDEQQARDAFQEVFVRLIRYGKAFPEVDNPVRWLYRVAERVCFGMLKSRKAYSDSHEIPQLSDTSGASNQLARVSDREIIFAFLGEFSDKMKQVVLLHYLDGLSQGKIAKETGWSRQTVNKKLAKIRMQAEKFRGSYEVV